MIFSPRITLTPKSALLFWLLLGLCALISDPASAAAFDPQQATEAYMAQLQTGDIENSDAYFEGRYWLRLWGFLYTAAVCFFLLFTLISSYIRDLTKQMSRHLWLQVPFYFVIYTPLAVLLYFPFMVYKGYTREHQYDLSNQSFFQWLSQHLLSEVLYIITFALLATLIYTAIHRAKRLWWFWGGTVASLLLALWMILSPIVIEPMFNDFYPMEDGPLKRELLVMAQAQGIKTDMILLYDGSSQSDRMNGHISGLFGTTRIALSDTLLDKASDREIRAFVAHEIAHHLGHHIYIMLAGSVLMIYSGFLFLQWAMTQLIRRYGSHWRISSVGDLAGLPLMILLISSYSLLLSPVDSFLSRYIEDRADLGGMEIARDPDAIASFHLKMAKYRKATPNGLEEFLFYGHMPTEKRIFRAMQWKASHLNSLEN